MVTSCSPRPMREVQRARLWASTCTAIQAALAAKRPEGRWFSPTPYFRSRMAVERFDLGPACRAVMQHYQQNSSGVALPVHDGKA